MRLIADNKPTTHMTEDIFFISPLTTAIKIYERKPTVKPVAILKVKGIRIIVKKAGTAMLKSVKSISLIFLNIKTPTMIKAGAVAKAGTVAMIGEKNNASKKNVPVTMDARPVLAPSAIPEADSI